MTPPGPVPTVRGASSDVGDEPTVAELRPTQVEVDRDAIAANVRTIRRVSGAEVCAVVKADGYGHGAVRAAEAAVAGGAAWLGVAVVEEGERLRQAGITEPILVMAEPPLVAVDRMRAARLTPVAYTPGFLRHLDRTGDGTPDEVHLKADTGMHRVGVPKQDWRDVLALVASLDGVAVTGLMTHLACADELDNPSADRQLDAFDDFLALAREHGIDPSIVHAGNTAAALCRPRARHTMVRAGIGIYGLSASPEVRADQHDLVPALRWTSRVSFAKRVQAGDEVSYGHTWAAPTDGWLATLPVGYADGVPRRTSNRVEVVLAGKRRPLVGTVCMDQILVWCGDDEVTAGDLAVLIGSHDGVTVSADAWAEAADTITYEITCGIQRRVPRVDVTGGRPTDPDRVGR